MQIDEDRVAGEARFHLASVEVVLVVHQRFSYIARGTTQPAALNALYSLIRQRIAELEAKPVLSASEAFELCALREYRKDEG